MMDKAMAVLGLCSLLGMTLGMWIIAGVLFSFGLVAPAIVMGLMFTVLGGMFLPMIDEPLKDLGWMKK